MRFLRRLLRWFVDANSSVEVSTAALEREARARRRAELDWYRLCDQLDREGYDSLSDAQVVWVTVRGVIDATNNGGIVSYFYNSWAENYEDAVESLDVLDAVEVHFVLVTIGDLFGEAVPFDIDERNEIINSWSQDGEEVRMMEEADDHLYELFPDLERRLEAYLVANGLDPTMSID